MKDLLFDFTVDKSTNSVFVAREFAAGLPLVWDYFTKQELLDQWWAPKPWTSRTKFMDFKVGGRRFYAMVSPEGQEHWSIQDFTSITPNANFKYFDAFSDKDQNVSDSMPSSDWDLDFTTENGTTQVSIKITHQTLADLEQIIKMGFQGGFTMTLNALEQILKERS